MPEVPSEDTSEGRYVPAIYVASFSMVYSASGGLFGMEKTTKMKIVYGEKSILQVFAELLLSKGRSQHTVRILIARLMISAMHHGRLIGGMN